MPSSTSIPIIVQGNSFSLAIPLQIYVISEGSMVLQDYTPEPTDQVSIQLKGSRRQYTYAPTVTGNTAFIDLSGNEMADNYGVVVSIVKENGQRLRSFRTGQFFIVESSDDLTTDDIIEGLENNVIYLNSQCFVAGEDGRGIDSIVKTSTSGLVDTYTIYYSDNTTSTFQVTNGAAGAQGADGVGITSIEKTATVGLVDTYTITMSNGTTTTFDVTNGRDGYDMGLAAIINDLTTGGATDALSAEMGKVLAHNDLNLVCNNMEANKQIKSTSISTSSGNAISGYIDVSDGKSIIISKSASAYSQYCAFYDESKTLLSIIQVGIVQNQPNAIILSKYYPEDTYYLRYNINATEYNSSTEPPYAYKWDNGINWADVNFRGLPTFYNTKDNILVDYPASVGCTRNYSTGAISASANNVLCLIPVTANEKYIISPYSVSFQFVDANFAGVENFTDAINYTYYDKDWHNEGNIITAPSTAVYLYAIFSKADYEGGLCYMYKFSKRNVVDLPPLYKLERGIRSELYNKNVYVLGDSFSTLSNTSTSDSYKYHVLLKRKYGWSMTVNATSGRPIQLINNLGLAKDIDNLANLQTMPDLVIVWGGHNDVSGIYGDFADDSTQDTSGAVATYAKKNCLCGALRYICEVVHTLAPNAKLVFLTPMLTDHMKPSQMMADGTHQRWEIAEAIKEACSRYSAICIDMQGAGYHQWNTVEGATGTWSTDGTHPNKLGYKNIANYLTKKLSAEFVEYNSNIGDTSGTWWDYKETV